ncbi:hypothetical protein [Nocardia wallacei]|uniref:hypothetical protein n=1 Tax=Nocardia wallacei TaxID=480035 RepID=UPI002457B784|nr:hypothetical protein [Nocardia wallacei]
MADPHPGIGASRELNEYYLTGKGSGWKTSPTPYRTLRMELIKHMSLEKASGLAAEYYKIVFGVWPGKHSHDHQGRIIKKDK